MAWSYGAQFPVRDEEEEDENGLKYGEQVPVAFGDYSKATYGDQFDVQDLDPVPGAESSLRQRLLSSVNIASDPSTEFEPDDFRWGETRFEETEDKPTVYINHAKFEAAGASGYEGKMLLAESLHNLKNVDPDRYRRLQRAAADSHEYMKWAKESYRISKQEAEDRGEPEERNFSDWHSESRFDQVIGGYLFAQDPSIPTMADWSRKDLPVGEGLKKELDELEKALGSEQAKQSQSMMIRRPDPEEVAELQERYGPGLGATEQLTSEAVGGGFLGLPSKQEVLEQKYPRAKEKMQAMEDAAWEGVEEDSWGATFTKTLSSILPKFRRQIVGGMRAGNPVTVEDLDRNFRSQQKNIAGMISGPADRTESPENQRIAKEWGFFEGSDKVPEGVHPVEAFAEWLETADGRGETELVAAQTPVAIIAQDIWDAETGKLRENELRVKPHSLKFYAAGTLDAGINMGPAMAATIITKNPTIGAAIMGTQVYGDTYGSMLDRGYSPDQARAAALYSAAAETLTERVALGVLTRNNFTGLKRILAGASAEGIQEPLTEALQIGYDVGILNDDITMGEAMWRLIDAGIIGFGVGGGMGATVSALDRPSTPAVMEESEYESKMNALHLDMTNVAQERRALEVLEANTEALDKAINDQAQDLSTEELATLEEEKLIKIKDDGTIQVLPKGRRQAAKQIVEVNKRRKKEALRDKGVSEDELEPTVEILDMQPAYSVAEVETDVEPTDAQKETGNYKKGRFTWNGVEVAIENPAGSVRSGVNAQGVAWQQTMNSGYGYFTSKPGADTVEGKPTEGVDVYVGPDLTMSTAYVINQAKDPSIEAVGENFDEHKVMVGYPSQQAAIDAYKLDFQPARDYQIDAVAMQPEQLKGWLDKPKHDKPVVLGITPKPLDVRRPEEGRVEIQTPVPEGRRPGARLVLNEREGNVLQMDDIFVDEAQQRQGIGASLVAKAVEVAEETGRTLQSSSTILNQGLQMFEGLRRRGWTIEYTDQAAVDRALETGGDVYAGPTIPVVKRIEAPAEEAYDMAPVFHVVDETKPTEERYRKYHGKFVGISPLIKNKKSLKTIDDLIEKTVEIMEDSQLIPPEAWIWYENSGAMIRKITRGEPEMMHEMVKLMAAYSAGTGVAQNTTAMIKSAYQIIKGEPAVGAGMYPNDMARAVARMRELNRDEIHSETRGVGLKVMSFYRNLYDATFNTNLWPQAVTIDRWMARNLNYDSDSVTDNQYLFSEKILQDATARYNARNGTNWLPRHAQAAIWVHERSVDSLARTKGANWGKVTPVDAFSEHIMKATAKVTHEVVPSTTTEVGREVNALPREEKEELGRRLRENLADDNKHVVLEALNIPLYNIETGIGGYEGMVNPNEISNIAMLGGAKPDPEVADIFSTIMMYIHTQDAVPWFRADPRAKRSEKTGNFGKKFTQGVSLTLTHDITESQERVLFDELRRVLGPTKEQPDRVEPGFSVTGPGEVVIIDYKNEKGVPFSGLKPAEFVAKINEIVDNVGIELDVLDIAEFGTEGNNLTHDWEADPDAQALEERIEDYGRRTGRPDLLGQVRGWRKSAQSITRNFAQAKRSARKGAAASVPVDRLGDRAAIETEIFSRFGSVDRTRDTTEELKYYDLTEAIENPEIIEQLAERFGYTVEVFSFEEENFRIPRLGKQNYEQGTVWIYDPAAAHGSFKDETYTRAWRVSHEMAHGITERLMQERYGDSKRYGRLGRTMMGELGAPPKRIEVELDPLTLMQAQRAIEWEDVTFRVQRALLDYMGISIPDSVFNQEANVNMADAVFRTVTGDFADAGEFGFRPSVIKADMKAVLTGLERTEQVLAEEQGRDPTAGIDLETYAPISDQQLQEAVELQNTTEEPFTFGPLFHAAAEQAVAAGRPRGVEVSELKETVQKILDIYPGSPNVKLAATEAHLPQKSLIAIRHAGMEGRVGGMFDPETGEVYLIAANLDSMKEAVEVYLHETVGHYGIRSILGAEYDSIMDRIYAAFPAKVKAAARRNRLDLRVPAQRRLAAEEFIAYRSQRVLAGETLPAREASLLQRLVEALRIAIARLRGAQFSDAEIQRLIRKARMFVGTPASRSPGLLRVRKSPVMFSGLWKAINLDRVPNSASSDIYRKELFAQIRAGNITEADAEPLFFYLADAKSIDKAGLLEQIRLLGNQPVFSVTDEAAFQEGPFVIVDGQTGERVGKPYTGKTARKRARTRMDKLDLEYGAYRYRINRLDPETGETTTAFHVAEDVVFDPEDPKYPLAPRDEWYGDADYHQRGGRIVEMTPEEFLTDAARLMVDDVARENIDDLKRHILEGRQLDPLNLYEGTTVRDSDGRHRAIAAMELGIKKVPVVTFRPEADAPILHVNEYEGRADAIETGDLFENFTIEEGSKTSRAWNYLVFKAQDKFIDLLNIQKAIELQTGRPIDEALDAYLAEELFHGKVKTRVDRFEKEKIRPLIDAIDESDYTWDEIEWFLYARHAPEANAALYKINKATPTMVKEYEQDLADAYDDATRAAAQAKYRAAVAKRLKDKPELKALSGMSNEDAALAMETLKDKGDVSQLEAIAKQVDAMTALNRKIMVEEGLETQETIDAWEGAYKYYVPLKGWKDGPMNTTFFPKKGKGYDTGGKLNKRRLGRKSLAANILANVVAQHQSAVVLAEKAQVGRTLLNLVQQHPNPDLWSANEVETVKAIDKTTGLVTTRVDPTYKLRDNVLRVKVEGKDYHITFNEENAAAMQLARSIKNLSSEEMNLMFRTLLRFNRILSAVNTSYNPEFIVSNLARDLQTAMINLNATDANNMKMTILKDVFKAHRGIRRFLELPSAKDPNSADYWKEQFEEYRELGGQVGWLDNYKDIQDLEDSLYRQMRDKSSGMVSWATLRAAGKYIESENQAVENAVRLSAFVHAKTAGMSPRKAASLAKNLTVNFNRKGDLGSQLNAMYLFYNASIQGMAVMWNAAKSPKVRKVMYGIVAFAATLEILNRMMAGDDDDGENRYDKIPAWVKERNLIIMMPERFRTEGPDDFTEHYLTIPLPYGYNMLHVVGQKIGGIIDYTGIGNKREWKPMQDAAEILAAALGSFNPIGTGPTPLQTILPTVLTPFAQVSENVAWHGGPLRPEPNKYDPAPEPESQQYFRSVPKHAIALAEFLNKLGGGTRARPAPFSPLDISPETIQLVEDFLTGGAGRFVTNSIELGVMYQEEEIDWRRVPFARRFVGTTDERTVTQRYYENRTSVEYAVQEIKVATEQVVLAGTAAERLDAQENRARIIDQYKTEAALQASMKQFESNLKRLNTARKAIENSKRDDDWKEEKTELIQEKKTILMNKFNAVYNKLMQRQRDADEQARITPELPGKEQLAAVRQFNNAGYPATAKLIGSLPTQPGRDFMERLNA